VPQNDNPYLGFLAKQEQQPADTSPPGVQNPYLSLLAREQQAADIRRRSTLSTAIGTNPDAEAQARRLAQDLNVPPGAVRGMGLEQAQRQQQLQQIDQNSKQAPALSRAYTSEDFARIAHDDSQNLSDLERILTELGGRGFARGAAQDRVAALGAKKANSVFTGQMLTPAEELELRDAQAKLQQYAAGQEGRGGLSYFLNTGTAGLTSFLFGLPRGLAGAAAGAAVSAPAAAAGAAVLGQMGPQVATLEEIATVPAAAVGGALWGGRVGFVAGQAWYNYEQILGSSFTDYSNVRDQNGKALDPQIAAGAAHVNAILGVVLETGADVVLAKVAIPGMDKLLSKPGKDVVNRLLASEQGRNVLLRVGQRMGKAAGIEGLTEAAQQAIQILAGEGAKLIDEGDFAPITLPEAGQQIATAGLEGAIGGTFIAGTTAPLQIYLENREIAKVEREGRTSEREIGRVEAALDVAAKSKLAERDRGELERFVDEAAAESPVSTIYIAPDSLAQTAQELNVDVRALAAQLGVSDQLQDAALTGADIQMPVGKFIASVAGTDLAKPLLEVVKTDPFLYSRRDMQQLQESGNAEVIARAEQLVNAALTDQEFRAEAETVRTEVFNQLRASGRFTDDVNTVYAAATAQAYLTLAQRRGITPLEAWRNAPLNIRGTTITGQQPGALQQPQVTIEQAQSEGYTGQNIGEAQEWVRAREKGLDMSQEGRLQRAREMGFDTEQVLYHGTKSDIAAFVPSNSGEFGPGVYLTDFAPTADVFGSRMPDKAGSGLNIMPVVVAMKNPARITKQEWLSMSGTPREIQRRMRAKGHDGIIATGLNGVDKQYVIFDPANIRSVNAAFDPASSESANILAQSAVDLQQTPPVIQGTGPGGRVLNRDLGKFFTDRHMAKYGRALDPDNPADYEIILNSMLEDYAEQSQQPDTGDAWYTDDINEAIRLTSAIYSELQSSPTFRDLFLTVTALLSPQQKPVPNWDNAILALRSWRETGRLEFLKPNGKQYGVLSHTNGLRMLQHLIDTLGLEGALQWVQTEHTGREMAEMRMASGIFAPIDKATGAVSTKVKDYLPSETNLTESKLGIYAFGPKVGDFMQNSAGIDQNAVTVDLWLARTYNRYIGRLMDVSPKQAEEGAIASELRGRGERDNIKRLVRDAAAKVGLDASAMQAALWYFEQRLYRNFGIKSDSQNFSGAARTALERRGIDVPGPAESDQRAAGQDAGQGAGRGTESYGQPTGQPTGQPEAYGQTRQLDALGFYSAVQEAAVRIPDNIWNMGWQAVRNALAKGRDGITPKKTEIEYLGLDAMFGDTKLKGAELKEQVLEHTAAKRLALVENFARFDPNVKTPSKTAILDEIDDDTLADMIGVGEVSIDGEEGRVVASELDGANEFVTGLFVQLNKERSRENVRVYDLTRRLDNGEKEILGSDIIGNLRGIAARIIANENRNLVLRKISAETMREYWTSSRDDMAANALVRGPGDIRLPGAGVPLFEAVIGIPKGVPGAEYQAPVSHVGGKAKGTLVTAHGEERIDDKGQRTIFVGQVQSDMAQTTRETKKEIGDVSKATIVRVDDGYQIVNENGPVIPEVFENPDAAEAGLSYLKSNALNAPLITTSEWTNVAVRAMIYRAARGGFQSISFPTAETSEVIQGNDYAAQHYETNVKGALEKIARQLGGEVRRGMVEYDEFGSLKYVVLDPLGRRYDAFNSREQAAQTAKKLGKGYTVSNNDASAYILDLTPEMRSKIVSEGFPLFAPGRRGEYVPDLNEIRLNASSDLSTFLHELGHHFLEVYNKASLELADRQAAGEALTDQEQELVDDTRRLITEIARQTNTPLEGDALTWWNGLTFQQREPMHEQFARLTEAYFMDGKAPTPELQGMFATFRRWLLNVYKALTDLNVELSDEVRGVMDRMFAAQADIATAERNRGLNRLFSVKPEFMTDQDWEAYQRIAAQATTEAEEELAARSMRDMQWLSNARSRELRRLQRAAAEKRKAVEAEVTAEVMARPVNVARSFLRRGIGPDGEPVQGPHKLSIDILRERYPDISEVDWKRLAFGKYGMLAKDGMDPDMAAELLGYPSGDALITSLLSAEPAEATIEGETDRRMLERYGELTDETAMGKAADEAIHSALRGRVLQAEYAALAKAARQTKPLVVAAKDIARQLVGKMNAAKLNANKYLAAERAAGRKAEAALRKNDLTGAATAKRDQLLNFEIAREVQRVIKDRNRALDLFTRIVTAKRDSVAKNRNYDIVQAARAILAVYGMGRVKNEALSYLDAIKAYDAQLYSALEPTLLGAITTAQQLNDLSVEKFLGLRDVVKQLWDLSKSEKQIEIDGQQVELEQITNELNQQLEAQGVAPKGFSTEAPTEWQKRLRQFAGLKASLRRVEAWARLFDSGKVAAFTKYIWRPVSEAADRYRADRNKYILQFRDLFRAIEPTMSGGKINAPEINYTFTNKAELLHAILHTGNGSNKRKLLLGRGWGTEDRDGNLIDNAWQNLINRLAQQGVLTQADFEFAQSVWDLLDETKPLAQAAHRKVFGRYFSEITAEPVETPFGTFRGGYVPAIYDTYNVQDAALRAQQDAVEANDSNMFPSPANGFTKSRVDYNRELALDLRLLPQHIDKVLKFAHLASPVRDVLKILRDKGFSTMLESADPTAQSDMLLPWLQRASRQIVEEPTKGQGGPMVDGFFRAIRQRSGMGLMFANLVNVAQQVTGFSVAALTVKPKYLASGLMRYMRNPKDMTDTVRQASMMMRDRGDNQLSAMYGEIDKIIDKDDKFGQARDWFGRHTYFMQQGVQNVLDTIVWLGAYDQALADGATEKDAARAGDAAVRQTQGTTLPEDVSRIETGPAMLRSFVHMYGYFNMWGNLLSTEVRTTMRELGLKKGAGRLMFTYMAGFAVPALLAQAIADGLRGQLPEDEDDDGWIDEWMAWFFGTQVKTTIAFAPVVGQAATATIGAFTAVPYDDRVGGSPAISAIEAAVRTPASVYDAVTGGDKSRAVKDTLTLMTTMTGLPFQTLARPLGYAVDVAEGDVRPTSAVDFVRGLVTGTASEASR
jgi:hypothetical protein